MGCGDLPVLTLETQQEDQEQDENLQVEREMQEQLISLVNDCISTNDIYMDLVSRHTTFNIIVKEHVVEAVFRFMIDGQEVKVKEVLNVTTSKVCIMVAPFEQTGRILREHIQDIADFVDMARAVYENVRRVFETRDVLVIMHQENLHIFSILDS